MLVWRTNNPGTWSQKIMPLMPQLLSSPDEKVIMSQAAQQKRRCNIIEEGMNKERLKIKGR